MAQHSEIGMEDIPNYVMQNVLFPYKKEKSISFGLSLKGAIHKFEKETLKNAIKLCKTQQDLAKLLGVSQPTIARKLRQHGLIRSVEWN
jgi:transcriptional regulator of aromatic amino acid metabolism